MALQSPTASETIGNGCLLGIDGTDTHAVLSATFTENGNPIDVTLTNDTTHQYRNGISDLELSVELLGDHADFALGATGGASTITLSDGTTAVGTITNGLVTNVERSLSVDGQFVTSMTIKQQRQ